MDENKKNSVEDLKQALIDKGIEATKSGKASDAKYYADAVTSLDANERNEALSLEEIDISRQKAETEKKSSNNVIWAAFASGLFTLAGIVLGKFIDGHEDRKYQEEGYNHEKTENTIYKYNKHSRPKHNVRQY